ncbi:hypothetical protein HALLA_13385 [Halostagnicola larsenii XH-48]|uniref:Uncharacterized protein n=1 Tax=Halostagnicola larsenii XH-48 TaxID=797299 RepID=W0JVE2_9EURY|nr:hypothetical protein HALLA_13385 [Halostagnicola larsenii XH-48]
MILSHEWMPMTFPNHTDLRLKSHIYSQILILMLSAVMSVNSTITPIISKTLERYLQVQLRSDRWLNFDLQQTIQA